MKKLLCATIISAAALFSLAAQSNNLQPLAVVKLNGHETITLKDLKDSVETYQTQTRKKFTVSERKEILESLIDQKLIVQAAKKEGISYTDSQVDQYYLANMSQMVGRQVTEKEFADLVRQQTGKSVDEFLVSQVRMNVSQYKTYLRNQLLAQAYVIKQKGDEINRVKATDKEIRDFYELNKSKLVWNDMIHMVLVSVKKGNDEAAARAKIEGLKKDFENKKLTLDDMRAASKNPSASGYVAGDLMLEKTEQYAAALGVSYEQVLRIFSEEKNVASDILETAADWQFYVILDKYDAKMLQLKDVVQPGSKMTVYEFIEQNLTNQKKSTALVTAIQDISKKLNTKENVDRVKSDKELDTLLAW